MDLLNAATCLDLPSLYAHDARPEPILIGRRELERCARATLERAMLEGGGIAELSLAFLEAVDALLQCGRQADLSGGEGLALASSSSRDNGQ